MKTVKFPLGNVIHVGTPGKYQPVCGQTSSADPKNVLLNTAKSMTCRPCRERLKSTR